MRRYALAFAVIMAVVPSTIFGQTSGGTGKVTPLCVTGCIASGPGIALGAPTGNLVVYSSTPYIEIHFCMGSYALDPTSYVVKVNGTIKTSSFANWTSGDPGGLCGGTASNNAYVSSNSVTLNAGANTLYAYVCDTEDIAKCTSVTWTITYLPRPVLSLAPFDSTSRDFGRCAVACFNATYAQSTVPYFTRNAPRNVTLLYNSVFADPRPFVFTDVTHGGTGSNLPQYFYLKLQKYASGSWLNITFVNGETEMRFAPLAGVAMRLAGQFASDSNGMTSDSVYAIRIVVGADYGTNGRVEDTASSRVIVLHNAAAPMGIGWGVAGVQRLIPVGDSALIEEGDGSAWFFKRSGSSTFTSPPGDFSVLSVSGTGTGTVWKRAYTDSSVATFNYTGHMTSSNDRFGNTVTYAWSGSHLTSITDPQGTLITIGNYGVSGTHALSVLDALSRNTQGWVSATDGLLQQITDPDGASTAFSYDANSRLRTVVDRGGNTIHSLAYDAHSKLIAADSGPSISVFSGGTARPVTTFAAWLQVGVPYSGTQTSPYFGTARSDTVRGSITDPGGHGVSFTANSFGQPLVSVAPLNDTTTATYNSNGQPSSVSERLGLTEAFSYDGSGRLTYDSSSAGSIHHLHYTTFYLPDSTWGNREPTQYYWLSVHGRIDSLGVRRAADIVKTHLNYDSLGRIITARDNLGHLLVAETYGGALNNRTKDSTAGGLTVSYIYDVYGRDSVTTQSFSPSHTTIYDGVNRVTEIHDGVHSVPIRFAYDSLRLKTVTDIMGQVYATSYNALGWPVTHTDPAGKVDSVLYDVDGLIRHTRNRDTTRTLDITYDALHRQLVRSGGNVTADSMSYSSDGRKITASSNVESDTLFLSARLSLDSQKTRISLNDGGSQTYSRSFSYAANGLLNSYTTSGGGITFLSRTYAWDTTLRNVIDSIQIGTGNWTAIRRNGDLQVTTVRFPGADSLLATPLTTHQPGTMAATVMLDSLGYDSAGRMDYHGIAGGPRRGFTYTPTSQLSDVYFGSGACTWSLDLGRCVSFSSPDSTEAYQPDANGNLTARSMTNNYNTVLWSLSGVFDTTRGNRIQSLSGTTAPGTSASCSYSEDDDGNVTSRSCSGSGAPPSATFGWDGLGHLTSIAISGGPTISLYYNAAGQLVRRDSAGVSRYFLWNGDDLFAELGPGGTSERAEFAYLGTDAPLAVIIGGTPYYAQQDALGNVRGLSNNGIMYKTYRYDELGHLETDSGPSSFDRADRPRFKGALWMAPEVDLYYMRNRWYEPWTGRFISEDPVGLAGGLNKYAYSGGDPINNRDPSGLNNPLPPGAAQCIGNADGSRWYACTWIDDVAFAILDMVANAPFPTASGFDNPGGAFGGGAGGGLGASSQAASQTPKFPSCSSIEYRGTTGSIHVQTNPQNGYVAWGIYMHDFDNAGAWEVTVYVNGRLVDTKAQDYAPHGTIDPRFAPSGAVVHIRAIFTDTHGNTHTSMPNACIVP